MTSVESKILEALEKMEFGGSCTEISKQIDVSRPTVLKYLEVMKAKGQVDYKEIGMAKLWHSHKPHLMEMIEEEKEKADHRLKELLNTVGDGVAILDKDMKFVWANKVFKKQVGAKLSKIKGKYCYDILRGEKEICSDCYAKDTLETGKIQTYEKIYQDVHGKKHHCDILTSPMRDKENKIIGVLTLSRDITEKKKLEDALKEAEERYMDIFNNINVAVYRTTPGKHGKVIDMNPAHLKIFGHDSKEEMLKTRPSDFYKNPEERESINEELLKEGFIRNREVQFKRKDGSLIWCLDTAVAVKDENGKVKYYDGFIEDITEKKKLEDALKESEEKYEEICDNINIAIYRSTPGKHGKLIDVNPAQLKIFGHDSKEEMLKNKPSDYYKNPEEREKWNKELLEKGFIRNREVQYKRADGSVIWCLDTAVAVKDENGKVKYYDGFIEDIAERKKLEEALKKSEERYMEIVNNTNVAVYRNSPGIKGKHLDVNPAYVKIFGYKNKEDALNTSTHDTYVDLKEKEEFERLMREQGYVENLESEYRKRDGGIVWVREKAVAVKDNKGKIKCYDGILEDITERKKLEDSLKDSEEKYRSIFENVHAGVYRTSPGKKGKFIDANSAILKILGYKNKEELLEINVCDIYQNPRDREKFSEKMLKQGYLRDEVLKIKKKDGTPFLLRENAVAVKDRYGKVKYFDCIAEDVTKKKRLENALKDSEKKFRGMVENLPVGIYRTIPGKKGQWAEANPTIVKMYGYKNREELLKVPTSRLYKNLEDREKFNEKVKKYGFMDGEEFEYKRKDGSTFWGRISDRATYDDKGKIIHYDGIIEDITERKRLKEYLKKSEEEHRELVENAPDVIYSLNPKGEFISVNPTIVKLLGYPKEELLGKNFSKVVHPDDCEKAVKSFREQVTGKKDRTEGLELRFKTKQGKIIYGELNSRATCDKKGNFVKSEGIGRDITERKRLEEALKESEKRYGNIFENMNVGIYRCTPGKKGKFVEVNPAYLRILGYKNKRELFRIKTGDDYINPQDKEDFDRKLLEDGYVESEEIQYKRGDGKAVWIRESAVAVKDENGKVKYYDGIIEDITEEKGLKEKYWRILESSKDVTFITTKKGKLLHMNLTGVKFFGYKDRDTLLRIDTVRKLYANPKERDRFLEIMEKEGFVKDFKTELKRKDGRKVKVFITANARRDDKHKIIGYEGIIKRR